MGQHPGFFTPNIRWDFSQGSSPQKYGEISRPPELGAANIQYIPPSWWLNPECWMVGATLDVYVILAQPKMNS